MRQQIPDSVIREMADEFNNSFEIYYHPEREEYVAMPVDEVFREEYIDSAREDGDADDIVLLYASSSDEFLEIGTLYSSEAFDIMRDYAEMQIPEHTEALHMVLNGRKPYRSFKDKIFELGIIDSYYLFEMDEKIKIIKSRLEELEKEGK